MPTSSCIFGKSQNGGKKIKHFDAIVVNATSPTQIWQIFTILTILRKVKDRFYRSDFVGEEENDDEAIVIYASPNKRQ